MQKVIDKRGRACGAILWETKNAQWSEPWLGKLRADQREAKAQIAVLVAANPPEDVATFLYRDSVWIVRRRYARDLASLLRYSLISVNAERANQAGKDEKVEVLYAYLTSVEFQHRVQAIVEGFTYLFNDVEREKRWFETKWARQSKEIRKIIDSTQGCTAIYKPSPTGRCRRLLRWSWQTQPFPCPHPRRWPLRTDLGIMAKADVRVHGAMIRDAPGAAPRSKAAVIITA